MIKKYSSIQELMDDKLKAEHTAMIQTLRLLIKNLGWLERLQRNSLVFRFPNNMWVYINMHNKKFPILWVSHVYKLLAFNPMLDLYFDKKEKFVGKIYLKDEQIIEHKWLAMFLEMIWNFQL